MPTPEAIEFFSRQIPSWHRTDNETTKEARLRAATDLAEAEEWLAANGLQVVWQEDWDVDHQKEFEIYSDGGPETCEMAFIERNGEVLASLGCIDDATPNYRRVIAAQLAGDARAEIQDRADAPETIVRIPGFVWVHLAVDNKVTSIAFVPNAGDAGYFGPSAVLWEGDTNLDLEDTDGPFWKAVQGALADPSSVPNNSGLHLRWEE